MARTLIVTDPLALVAPPGPSTARTLTASLPLAIDENALTNTVRVYEAGIGTQSLSIFRPVDPALDIIAELPSPVFSTAEAAPWSLVNYV